MPTVLSDLELNEISLVDSPANKGAKILLYKRDHSMPDTTLTATQRFIKAVKSLARAKTDDEVTKAEAEVEAALATEVAEKASKEEEAKKSDPKKSDDENKSKDEEDKMKKSDENDLITKAVNDAVSSALAKREAETAEELKKRDDRIAKLEDDKLTHDLTEVAQKFAAAVPVEKSVPLMKKMSAEDRQDYVDAMTAVVGKLDVVGLFGEIGTSGGGSVMKGATPFQKLNKKAEELRKVETTLTSEQAFTKVFGDPENFALVQEYQRETAL